MKLKNGYMKYKGKRIRQTKEGRFEADLGRSSGRHIRKRFETLQEAKDFVDKNDAEVKLNGVGIAAFTTDERADYADAVSSLAEFGATLKEAVAFYRKHHQRVETCQTMRHHIGLYLKDKRSENLRPHTLRDMDRRMMKLESQFAKSATDMVTPSELDAWLDSEAKGDTARANLRRSVSAYFQWAVKKDIIDANPVAKTRIVKLGDKTPRVYTSGQIQSIMTACEAFESAKVSPHAKKSDKGTVVLWFVLATFGGLRPAEASRVEWSDIDLSLGEIHIRKDVSKTGHERIAHIPANAVKWLASRRKASGLVFPYAEATLIKWRREIMKLAGVTSIQDGLRHTSVTMSICSHGYDETASSHGHDIRVLRKHYAGLVRNRKAQAKAFYQIEPSGSDKIIALTGAA